ncbi:phosphotransferase, partial [Actinomyces sp. MRS3W]|uniref:phosphotransferase n=1 Tax=Actinomyces sp. MRS3W TaxID=2800796 RepID=UPI0028FDC0FB
GTDRVRKLVRPGRARRLANPDAARPFTRAGLRIARVLERSPARLDLELLPGRSLHDLGDAGLPAWERFAQLWPGAVQPQPLPAHTGADEAAVLDGWFHRADGVGGLDLLGAPRRHLEAAVNRVCALLQEEGEPLAACHRDLHDGQLLWDGRTLSLLDLDTAAAAEPALDLGNLAAHVDLMRVQGQLGGPAYTRIGRLLDDVAARVSTEPRLAVYYLASRLRLGFVHAFRPGASAWLPAWTDGSLRLAASPAAWAARGAAARQAPGV